MEAFQVKGMVGSCTVGADLCVIGSSICLGLGTQVVHGPHGRLNSCEWHSATAAADDDDDDATTTTPALITVGTKTVRLVMMMMMLHNVTDDAGL